MAAAATDQDAPIVEEMSMGMSWLYRMLAATQMRSNTAYGDRASKWLAKKVDADDPTEFREQSVSVWWENEREKAPPKFLKMPVIADGIEEEDEEEDEPEQQKAADVVLDAEDAKRADSTYLQDSVQLSLSDVLDSPVFLADFRAHLEEIFAAQSLNFLEEHAEWVSIDFKAYPARVFKGAQHLYDKFVDPSGEEIVSVPAENRKKIRELVETCGEKFESWESLGKVEQEQIVKQLTDAFENLVRAEVLRHIESNLFPRFTRSEDYQEMVAVRFEEDPEAGAAAEKLKKGSAWSNDKGYKSLSLTLIEGADLALGTQNHKAWAFVTVDSRTYQSDSKSMASAEEKDIMNMQEDKDPDRDYVVWKEHFEFPISSTTQHLKLSVYTKGLMGNTHLGRCIVPLAMIQAACESSEATSVFPLLPKSKGEKVQGELRLAFNLSTADAKEDQHKPVVDSDDTNFFVSDKVRGLVSKKKKRYKTDGFDLDLTYITDRIIAMGFPSESLEGVYRNRMQDVQRFFDKRHPRSYRVYNLCSERAYDPDKFKGRVARYPFDDHNPPDVDTLKAFCQDVHEWLELHPQNVAAIHCKAGKGRTGTVIASYFVYAHLCPDAESALQYFGIKRTKNAKGVTIPSQMRYVNYFDHYCRLKRLGYPQPAKTSMFLQSITFHDIPASMDSIDVYFTIVQNNLKALQYKSKGKIEPVLFNEPTASTDTRASGSLLFDFGTKPILLTEDQRVEFHKETTFGKDKLFQFWFNTRYIVSMLIATEQDRKNHTYSSMAGSVAVVKSKDLDEETRVRVKQHRQTALRFCLSKAAIDKACKDKKHKSFPETFRVELLFLESKAKIKSRALAFKEGPVVARAPRAAAVQPAAEVKNSDDIPTVAKSVESTTANNQPAGDRGPVPEKPTEPSKKAAAKPILKIGNLMSVKVQSKK